MINIVAPKIFSNAIRVRYLQNIYNFLFCFFMVPFENWTIDLFKIVQLDQNIANSFEEYP